MSERGAKGPARCRRLQLLALAVVLAVTMSAYMASTGTSRTAALTQPAQFPPLSVEEATALEERYSPVLLFSSGERTYPVAAEYFLDHSRLVSFSGRGIDRPGASDLGGAWGSSDYLDLTVGTRGDGRVIEHYEIDRTDIGATVYVRTAEGGGEIMLQYWLLYVFNQGTFNSHEGDWELVQVVLDRETMTPTSLLLSRHHSMARSPWERLESADTRGDHPCVLVAAGSHANYLPSSDLRAPGDRADGSGEAMAPGDYDLVRVGQVENGTMSPSWLLFPGAWGEIAPMGGMLGTAGPPGPMYREGGLMWSGLGWGS